MGSTLVPRRHSQKQEKPVPPHQPERTWTWTEHPRTCFQETAPPSNSGELPFPQSMWHARAHSAGKAHRGQAGSLARGQSWSGQPNTCANTAGLGGWSGVPCGWTNHRTQHVHAVERCPAFKRKHIRTHAMAGTNLEDTVPIEINQPQDKCYTRAT